jgi:DNA modification methylase
MLKDLPDESIDLSYSDPPFNSNRNYEVFWGDVQEKRAFDDRFGDADAYIKYMRPRVMEIYRVLKKTGSFYYHCDWHASHYVKIMLDQIFGFNNFQNEIIWQRTNAHNDARKRMPNLTDSIFYYSKSDKCIYNTLFKELEEDYIKTFYKYKDNRGYYMSDNLTGPKISKGESGKEWKGYNPSKVGRSWAVPNIIIEELVGKEKCNNMGVLEKLNLLNDNGYITFSKNGVPRVKRYIDKSKGTVIGNIWIDIPPISSQAKERLGYPTQKPIALLERIINASSEKGNIVLDPFCGCGTTIIAAQKNKRKWIGIDISPTACRVMSQRLYDDFRLIEGKDFQIEDLPKTEEELRAIPHFEFQNWAVIALGQLTKTSGIPNIRKSGDMGIDGRLYPVEFEKKKDSTKGIFGDIDNYYPVQVKQMDKVGRQDIDNFETAIRRDGRNRGYFVAFDYSSHAKDEVKRLYKEGDIEIILISVKDLIKAEQIK